MTVKQLQDELNKERYDVKGADVLLSVGGAEYPLASVQMDEERGVVVLVGTATEEATEEEVAEEAEGETEEVAEPETEEVETA